MSTPSTTTIYDLVLMLDAAAPSDARSKIAGDVEAQIKAGGGEITSTKEWGERKLTYEIDHRDSADYRLLQFEAPPTLIESLSRALRITDGVVRARIIKSEQGSTPPDSAAPPPLATVTDTTAPAVVEAIVEEEVVVAAEYEPAVEADKS